MIRKQASWQFDSNIGKNLKFYNNFLSYQPHRTVNSATSRIKTRNLYFITKEDKFWNCFPDQSDSLVHYVVRTRESLRSKSIMENKVSTIKCGKCNATFSEEIHMKRHITKGQLISKCPFGVMVWTKIPTKIFDNFCPRIWKGVKS